MVAIVLGLGPAGCYEGFDPLDAEVLAEVARGRGDAEGFERSGIYGGTFEALECGCDSLDQSIDVSLCNLLDLAASVGFEDGLGMEVVQADGSARVEALALTGLLGLDDDSLFLPLLYGSLQADGSLSAAGVLQADAIIARGQVLARVDGTLDGEPGAWRLQLEYQQRYVLDLLGGGVEFAVPSVVQSTDCRERIAVDLIWVAPPLQPLGGS